MTDFDKLRETIERGGAARYHEAAAARGKLFARDRIAVHDREALLVCRTRRTTSCGFWRRVGRTAGRHTTS